MIKINRSFSSVQRLVFSSKPITDTCLGSYFGAIVTNDGAAYAWGQNTFFELSPSNIASFDKLKKMNPGTGQISHSQVALGKDKVDPSLQDSNDNEGLSETIQTSGITNRGSYIVDRIQEDPQINPKTSQKNGFVYIRTSPSTHSTFYLTQDFLASVGPNTSQMLGVASKDNDAIPRVLQIKTRIVGVSAGNYHALCWSRHGKSYAWGRNMMGVCGVNNNRNREKDEILVPEEVKVLEDSRIIEMAAGKHVSFGVTHKGKIFYWGRYSSIMQTHQFKLGRFLFCRETCDVSEYSYEHFCHRLQIC